MADIFISYSRRDASEAQALAERLRSAGASVWMDTALLAAAETWSAEIVNAIEGCTHFVVLLSEASVASTNVTKEVALASESKKTIVPVELGPCELNPAMKYALAGLQKVSLADDAAFSRSMTKLGIAVAAGGQLVSPTPTPTTGPIRIAVLPFEDQSPGHDNEWFSDGLTDELISTLNKLTALFVLDRNSSKIYRDVKLTTQQIARELHVQYVVTGTVRKAGEKVRIQASLISGATGATIWDDKFNGTMEDIFEIQEQTARDIAEGLKLKLTPEEEMLLDEKFTSSVEAFQFYLQARELGNIHSDREGALRLVEKALDLDPTFLPALQLRAITYSNLYRNSIPKEKKWLDLQKETIRRIGEIDPNSYYMYGPRANYYVNIGESELAIEMAKKMVELQPKKPSSHFVLSFVYNALGDPVNGIPALEKALEVDPGHTASITALVMSYTLAGDTASARRVWERGRIQFERRLEQRPDSVGLRVDYLTAAECAGAKDVSIQQAEYLLAQPVVSPEARYNAAGILSKNGRVPEAIAQLRQAIDDGWAIFSDVDPAWFEAMRGTEEYQFLLDHVVR